MVKRFLYRILCGFFLGVSVFAPGFSGSVIAIVMGIYQDLVRIVSNPFKKLKQNIIFCLPLGIGAAVSFVLFVYLFNTLFESHEKATYLLFIGLMAGNLPVIFTEVKKCKFQKRYIIGGVGAFAAALALSLFATGAGFTADAGAAPNLLIMGFSGLAAGAALLMPGMSVSMVLIIAGVYNYLIATARSLMDMDFTNILPFGLFGICALIGLVLTSKGIKHIFDKFPGFANSMVLGFMAGSLIGITVQSLNMPDDNFNWLLGCVMLAVGLGISMLFVVLGRTMNKEEAEA